MANNRRCPPVATRGVFKFITYLIPIRECQPPNCSLSINWSYFYWIFLKLKEGFFLLWFCISYIPLGSVIAYLQNVNFSSVILQSVVAKCNFFLIYIKPVLDRVLGYFSRFREDTAEEVVPEEEPEKVEVELKHPISESSKCSFVTKECKGDKDIVEETWPEGIGSRFRSNIYASYTRIVKPIQNALGGIKGLLHSIGEHMTSSGNAAYLYLANCPTWVYAYIIFVVATVAYILYETYVTYMGRIWAANNAVPSSIREGCKNFILSDTTLKEVMKKLRTEIDKGLNPKTKSSSSVKCFTTYVQDLPTGNENGRFLALDLGGTNFRVLLITLNGRHFDMQSKIYAIPQDAMVGTSKNLFNHIAQCLKDFTKEHKVNKSNLPLGFTFSFPLKQEGLTKGILQRWTKGFNCPEAVGQDVVELLKEAIAAHGDDLKIDIMAILNDTTGTLMSCAWKNHNTKIGVILGTGTNACYVEKIENVIEFDGDKSKPHVLINSEWGAFGDNGELDFIKTPYDNEIDANSINPGLQLHEKLISGMYLGEIVRLLLVKFANDKLLFDGKVSEKLGERGSFLTEYISEIESDKRGIFKNCRKTLGKCGYNEVSDEDCNSVRYICECVSRRAAHLASAGLATLINKMQYTSLTIGVDGSLYRYHPHFHDLMVEKISQLIDDKIMNVNLMLSQDGSGRGAALVAASLC